MVLLATSCSAQLGDSAKPGDEQPVGVAKYSTQNVDATLGVKTLIEAREDLFLKSSVVQERIQRDTTFGSLPNSLKEVCFRLDNDAPVLLVRADGDIEWPLQKDVKGKHMVMAFSKADGMLLGARMSREPLE